MSQVLSQLSIVYSQLHSTFTEHSPCTRCSARSQDTIMKKEKEKPMEKRIDALSQNYHEVW